MLSGCDKFGLKRTMGWVWWDGHKGRGDTGKHDDFLY